MAEQVSAKKSTVAMVTTRDNLGIHSKLHKSYKAHIWSLRLVSVWQLKPILTRVYRCMLVCVLANVWAHMHIQTHTHNQSSYTVTIKCGKMLSWFENKLRISQPSLPHYCVHILSNTFKHGTIKHCCICYTQTTHIFVYGYYHYYYYYYYSTD